MFEVEAKAHVTDRAAVISILDKTTLYLGSVHKTDRYYKNEAGIKPRIRIEEPWYSSDVKRSNPAREQILLTYKRKETKELAYGKVLEVNDEKECTLSDAEALHTLLLDSGFQVYLEKEKFVIGWTDGRAHIELCTVPPLGDFLEIEIMSKSNSEHTLHNLRKQIRDIFRRTGISEDQIENRYYSDMLREAEKNTHSAPGSESVTDSGHITGSAPDTAPSGAKL